MEIDIHPIQLFGNWDIGYALDQHIITSTYIRDDPFGNPIFDSTYSEIGILLRDFKYKHRYENLDCIVSAIKQFLAVHPEMSDFESIVPVPPSRERDYQPTFEICETLADELDKFFIKNVLIKQPGFESKNMTLQEKQQIQGTIHQKYKAKRKHSVLLVDDLFKTGATLSECVNVLRHDELIDKIYVLAITKTKNQS